MIQPYFTNSKWDLTKVMCMYYTDEWVTAKLYWWDIINTVYHNFKVLIKEKLYDVASIHYYNQGTHIEVYYNNWILENKRKRAIVKSEVYDVDGELLEMK